MRLVILYVPGGMCTGQLLAIALLIVVWKALVSSWLPSPTAPLQRTSIHGFPEHISTSPLSVAVPVADSEEKFPGDCARLGNAVLSPKANAATLSTCLTMRWSALSSLTNSDNL